MAVQCSDTSVPFVCLSGVSDNIPRVAECRLGAARAPRVVSNGQWAGLLSESLRG